MALYVGTSGFAFKGWKGPFYPEELKGAEMLAYYSGRLPSVEINYTFRRLPSESVLQGWRRATSEGFRFTLKAPQRITHIKRLIDVAEEVDELIRRARLLGDRLGTVLFQLPPSLRFDRALLTTFLAQLPPVARYAMEFRHDSWRDPAVASLLADQGAALCGAETDKAALDEIPRTAPHAYLRLRKESYTKAELEAWAGRIAPLLKEGRDVYCYFKHEGGGAGPAYALALKEALGYE